jgi:hypothetical protein
VLLVATALWWPPQQLGLRMPQAPKAWAHMLPLTLLVALALGGASGRALGCLQRLGLRRARQQVTVVQVSPRPGGAAMPAHRETWRVKSMNQPAMKRSHRCNGHRRRQLW